MSWYPCLPKYISHFEEHTIPLRLHFSVVKVSLTELALVYRAWLCLVFPTPSPLIWELTWFLAENISEGKVKQRQVKKRNGEKKSLKTRLTGKTTAAAIKWFVNTKCLNVSSMCIYLIEVKLINNKWYSQIFYWLREFLMRENIPVWSNPWLKHMLNKNAFSL